MTIAPASLLSLLCIPINLLFFINELRNPLLINDILPSLGNSIFLSLISSYLQLFFMGTITTLTEWKQIHCNSLKKILYLFSFPIFIFTYIPISIIALFKKVKWTPIAHNVIKTVEEIQ